MSILLISFGPDSLGWQILELNLVNHDFIWISSHLVLEILVLGRMIRNKTQIKYWR